MGLLGSTALIPSDKYIQSQDVAKVSCNEVLLDKNLLEVFIDHPFLTVLKSTLYAMGGIACILLITVNCFVIFGFWRGSRGGNR